MTAAVEPRFVVPPGGDADAPPESRGVTRDGVRLLVATPRGIGHHVFRDLPDVLSAGDLVVVNTSATLPAAVDVRRADGSVAPLHVAGSLDDGTWVVEVRRPGNDGPGDDARAGEHLLLPGGVVLTLGEGYPDPPAPRSRLRRALPDPFEPYTGYLSRHGRPIRYRYVRDPWPLSYLQNVYADTPGSAEMPSAGRPFTSAVLRRLECRGVAVARLVLHTGVSSPETHEPPVPEWYSVPEATAHLVTRTRAAGHRVVAVGTTVVRALESVEDRAGEVRPGRGWTDLVLGPDRPARVVDTLVTGLHAPEASHLGLLEAVVGAELVDLAYREAVARRYRWHEFGDSMLLSKV